MDGENACTCPDEPGREATVCRHERFTWDADGTGAWDCLDCGHVGHDEHAEALSSTAREAT